MIMFLIVSFIMLSCFSINNINQNNYLKIKKHIGTSNKIFENFECDLKCLTKKDS